MEKLRIVTLGFGTGRQRKGLDNAHTFAAYV
jgi:hypothetical protein